MEPCSFLFSFYFIYIYITYLFISTGEKSETCQEFKQDFLKKNKKKSCREKKTFLYSPETVETQIQLRASPALILASAHPN